LLSDVREQDRAVAYLRKVVEGRITTPLLLVGSDGVGRRFSAIETAREHFSGGDPKSKHCFQIDHVDLKTKKRNVHPDLTILEPEDDKDIGIDAIREVTSLAYNLPTAAPRRYIIIDGADRLTVQAANAILKTLEEPPKKTQFFLTAETAEAVIPTIRSRCGEVRYNRLSEKFLVDSIVDPSERSEIDPNRLLVCARLAEGSLGRASKYFRSNRLELRDRVLGLLKMGARGALPSMFSMIDEDSFKPDLKLGIRFLEHLLYDLAMLPYAPTRITNLDKIEELRVVREQVGEKRLTALNRGMQLIQTRAATTKVHLAFQLKSCLATAFTE
jgi:hypothetical protein